MSVFAWRRRKQHLQSVFEDIYLENAWAGAHSRSGPGSDPSQTLAVRAELRPLLDAWNCTSLLDVPCGDWEWMREVDLSGIDYVGMDIVPQVVSQNAHRYGGPGRRFVLGDVTSTPVPRVDVILCRDLLVHLSDVRIVSALRQFRASGSTYLLTTTFEIERPHTDIADGSWRPLCLTAAPFSFPPPLAEVDERCTVDDMRWTDKRLALWRLADLPDS